MANTAAVNRRKSRSFSFTDSEFAALKREAVRESAVQGVALNLSKFVRLRCVPGELSVQDQQEPTP